MKVPIKIIQEINRLYEEDCKVSYIANKLGLSDGTIRNYVWKPRTKGGKTSKEKIAEINRLYPTNSIEKIANKLDLSWLTVSRHLEQHKRIKESVE